MQIKLPHKGTADEGVAHIKQLLEQHKADIEKNATDVELRWEGYVLAYSFTAQGSRISGTLTVRDKEYELYAKLPLAMRLFEGTIQRMVDAEVQKLLKQ